MNMDGRPQIYAGRDSVIARVPIGGRLVRVIVSREALETRFDAGDSPQAWVDTYRANAETIEAVIRGKVAKASPEPVMVSKHDF
ncbi:MAG: DUF1488 family protein [Rubrivivax sp.]|nr:MAG: DUF1488 family protein [Rubrivivax sp.]